MASFQPRQRLTVLPHAPQLLAGLQGCHGDVADFIFATLPPLAADSKIHDIGCAQSRVTPAAIAACPAASKSSLTIHATDENEALVARAKASLPTEHTLTAAMPSDVLSFGDESLSHSIINVGLPTRRDPSAVAREMYRTLRHGGVAVASYWTYSAPGMAINQANDEFHTAKGRKPKSYMKPESLVPENMVAALVQGGFDPGHIRTVKKGFSFVVQDLRAFVEAVWAVLGECEDGWTQADEDEWEATIDRALQVMKGMQGMIPLEAGGYSIERECAVVIAEKP